MGKYGLAQAAGFFGETPSDNQLTVQRSGLSLYPDPSSSHGFNSCRIPYKPVHILVLVYQTV